MRVPILLEEIDAPKCSCRKRPGKLVLVLAKAEPAKPWYELRKTKGVGDTEFNKLVPNSGEEFVFTL